MRDSATNGSLIKNLLPSGYFAHAHYSVVRIMLRIAVAHTYHHLCKGVQIIVARKLQVQGWMILMQFWIPEGVLGKENRELLTHSIIIQATGFKIFYVYTRV